jgi:DNA repair exonuclease SbcCD ATPase subunit
MMSAETFLNAAKAIEMGLVDGYISEEDEDNDIQNKAIANVRQKATYYNKLPNQLLNIMDDKKTLLARFAEFLGFTKSDADEVLNTLPEAQIKAMEEEKEEKKEVIEKEEKEEKEDPMKAMEEKLKAMEDENKELKEQLKAMEEEKKKAESAKNELEAEISNSASYAKGGTESKSSGIFSKDLQDKFNEAFKNANFKNV